MNSAKQLFRVCFSLEKNIEATIVLWLTLGIFLLALSFHPQVYPWFVNVDNFMLNHIVDIPCTGGK